MKLTLTIAALLVFSLVLSIPVNARSVLHDRHDYDTIRIESHIPGLKLALLHESPKNASKNYPVLFLHGSVIPVNVSFGFRMSGYSWMDILADSGYDVYALDLIGYGNADRYSSMKNKVFSGILQGTATQVYDDVRRAMEYIAARSGSDKINLIGHSWGGALAALFAEKFPDRISKLILYSPYTIRNDSNARITVKRNFNAMTPYQRVESFRKLTPANVPCRMENEMFGNFASLWQHSDPLHSVFNDDSIRYPAGPEQDMIDLQHGLALYHPDALTVPVLLVRGEWDDYPNARDADILFSLITQSPLKKYVVIGKGTHIIHLEKSRSQLYDEVFHFLNSGNRRKNNQ